VGVLQHLLRAKERGCLLVNNGKEIYCVGDRGSVYGLAGVLPSIEGDSLLNEPLKSVAAHSDISPGYDWVLGFSYNSCEPSAGAVDLCVN